LPLLRLATAVAADRWIAGRAAAITVFWEIFGGSLGRRSSIVAFDPTLARQVLIPLLARSGLGILTVIRAIVTYRRLKAS
jgi:hypothetical protein